MTLLADVRQHVILTTAPRTVQKLKLLPSLEHCRQISIRHVLGKDQGARLVNPKETVALGQPHIDRGEKHDDVHQTDTGSCCRGTRFSTKIVAIKHRHASEIHSSSGRVVVGTLFYGGGTAA
jgi:hypothetical protein